MQGRFQHYVHLRDRKTMAQKGQVPAQGHTTGESKFWGLYPGSLAWMAAPITTTPNCLLVQCVYFLDVLSPIWSPTVPYSGMSNLLI